MRALKDGPCVDCGGKFPSECMDFDHVPERGPKLASVGRLLRDEELLQAEIAKCDLVCSNCHRIRTKARGGHAFQGWKSRLEKYGPSGVEGGHEARSEQCLAGVATLGADGCRERAVRGAETRRREWSVERQLAFEEKIRAARAREVFARQMGDVARMAKCGICRQPGHRRERCPDKP